MHDFALVTGASSGLGRQFSLLLSMRGINLVIHGRDRDELELTKEACSNSGVKILDICLDLCDRASCLKLYVRHEAHFNSGESPVK